MSSDPPADGDTPGEDATRRWLRSWQVLLAGVVVQTLLAAAVLGRAGLTGDRQGLLVGWYLLALVLVTAALAAIPFALMRLGRWQRLAGPLAVLVGIGALALTAFPLLTWVLPLSLFGAAILSWREATRVQGTPGG